MKDKITCFKLNWYDCGLCCPEDMLQEEVTIYRNDSRLVFKELNGYGVICSCQIVHIEGRKVAEFFDLLEKIYNEWEPDYKVEACDGSKWKARIWHSSHKIKTVCGTIESPPSREKIEKYIRSFIADANSPIEPKMFGCR